MPNKMLIDAAHPEETRVVVLKGNRVEEFDFESASKKPLRGNIYLAKVTRVEPSLQAAFIEYGGNRHGFLAFSEIHPDYYQIPVADRQALLDEEARAHREEEEEHRPSSNGRRSRRTRKGGPSSEKRADLGDESVTEVIEELGNGSIETSEDAGSPFREESTARGDSESEAIESAETVNEDDGDRSWSAADTTDEPGLPFEEPTEKDPSAPSVDAREDAEQAFAPADLSVDVTAEADLDPVATDADDAEDDQPSSTVTGDEDLPPTAPESYEADDVSHGEEQEDEQVEQLGGDASEDVPFRAPRLRRHYKIQEVIKRRQILLVQVVKEERGNKGAALTTYLSLAGRYSVLMPNTARGGGISRKITDADDRRRLKSIAQELDVPEGMGVILRTAGAARSDGEVRRDFEYLLRMWETVRELTLRSTAPMLVYEEGSLIKRAIRDLYSKEIDEVCVAGDAGYREAKDYMRLLMPTHTRNVQLYRDPQPIFAKSGVEAQLDAMFSNHVTLKSGGYIVINQTEALVAIDVNSGRSTREHNIEDTALRTNLEAADEVARQLRLRDLAGLIVVDFIDMEEGRNNRSVERRIKDALKNDRARIQIGRISHFGLLEMSRQRIRTGVLEGSTVLCPHCAGAGTVRSTSSIALHVLRVLEDTLIRSAAYNLVARTRTEVALYILNQKRAHLTDLEHRFGVTIAILVDAALTGTIYHAIERGEPATPPSTLARAVPDANTSEADDEDSAVEETEDEEIGVEADGEQETATASDSADAGEAGGERRRRRRRRRRGRERDLTSAPMGLDEEQPADAGFELGDEGNAAEATLDAQKDTAPVGDDTGEHAAVDTDERGSTEITTAIVDDGSGAAVEEASVPESAEPTPEAVEAPRRRRSRRNAARDATVETDEAPAPEAVVDAPPPRRARRGTRSRTVVEETMPTLGFEGPSADRDVGADTAKNHPPSDEPASVQAEPPFGDADVAAASPAEAEPDPLPAAATATVAASEDDAPPRPKRSGWWQRAKATLTGE